ITANNNTTAIETADAFNGSKNTEQTDPPSYIYANKNGTYTIASASDRIYIKTVDSDFKTVSDISFPNLNQKFSGYYYDGTYHYIITSNDYADLKNKLGSYVIEKYNNDGQKLKTSDTTKDTTTSYYDDGFSSSAANTTGKIMSFSDIKRPLLSKRLSIVSNGKLLSIADTAEGGTNSKGLRSFDVLFTYDMEHLNISAPYVFGDRRERYMDTSRNNAFMTYGFDNKISLCWKDLDGIYISGTLSDTDNRRETADIFRTYDYDAAGNKTFTLDGFESTRSSYVAVGTSVKQNENYLTNTDFNLFAASISKYQPATNKASSRYITRYSADDNITFENVHLVKKDQNTLIVIWQESNDDLKTVKYAEITGDSGNISQVKTIPSVTLSNCRPVYKNGKLVWFNVTENNSSPVMQSALIK
ncbi:MAG: hypothetical protein IJ583_01050, partial [Firmicutes bacterium]|nr:hypothetical protein [Bacillota bacterium]